MFSFFNQSWKFRMNENRVPLMSFSLKDESKYFVNELYHTLASSPCLRISQVQIEGENFNNIFGT